MKRILRFLVAVGLLLSAGGVGTAQTVGDSAERVAARLGPPQIKRPSGDREIWIYRDGRQVIFVDGAVVEVIRGEPPKQYLTATQLAPAPKPEPAKVPKPPEQLVWGTHRVLTMMVVLAAVSVYVVAFLLLNWLGAARSAVGGATLLLAFAVLFAFDLGVALLASGGTLDLPRLVRLVLTIGLMIGVWRGSNTAYGTLVVLHGLGVVFVAILLFRHPSWFMALPMVFSAGTLALLFTRPVLAFIDRDQHKERPAPKAPPQVWSDAFKDGPRPPPPPHKITFRGKT